MMLALPGTPEYNRFLAVPPPNQGERFYVVRPGSAGIMEAVSDDELDEYLLSGEYDERLDEIANDEIEINQDLRSDVIYLPCSIGNP